MTEISEIPKVIKDFPILVKVKLFPELQISMDKWKIDINDEERFVTMQHVQWYNVDLESAIKSFKLDQVTEFTITNII